MRTGYFSGLNVVVLIAIFFAGCKKNEGEEPSPQPRTFSVITSTVSGVTVRTAVAGGILKNPYNLTITEKGVCFATTPSPTINSSRQASMQAADTFVVNLTDLSENTRYYLRAYAIGENSVAYGEEVSFQTQARVSDPAATIYMGGISGDHDAYLIAINAETGAEKWSTALSRNSYASPAYSDGRIFVSTSDQRLNAFDTLGRMLWSVNVPGLLYNNNCIATKNMVYIAAGGSVRAYNSTSGSLIWSFNQAEGMLVQYNNTLYINNRYLYALDMQTGAMKWRYQTENDVTPIIDNGKLYVPVPLTYISYYDSRIASFNPASGELLNRGAVTFIVNAVNNAYNVKDGIAYVMNDYADTKIEAFNVASGVPVMPPVRIGAIDVAIPDGVGPVIDDEYGFAPGPYARMLVFDIRTGDSHTFPFRGDVVAGTTVVDRVAYWGTTRADLYHPVTGNYTEAIVYAYDYRNRQVKWSKIFNQKFGFWYGAPCIVTRSGAVYVGGKNGPL